MEIQQAYEKLSDLKHRRMRRNKKSEEVEEEEEGEPIVVWSRV